MSLLIAMCIRSCSDEQTCTSHKTSQTREFAPKYILFLLIRYGLERLSLQSEGEKGTDQD